MQTLLRVARLVLAASLLWTPPMFAATPNKAQKNRVTGKPQFIASHHHVSRIKLTYCDLRLCKDEKPRWAGVASFYGKHYWQGRIMANGNKFDYRKLTAASWGIPLGTMVRVTNLLNGNSVVVEITDRGPAHNLHRVADLSQAAAEQLDYIQAGTTAVLIQPVLYLEPQSSTLEAQLIEPPDMLATETAFRVD